MNRFFLFLLIPVLLTAAGCKTTSMSIEVTHPAPITIATDLKRVVLVNRTKAGTLSTVEGVLTGEGIFGDKANVEECLNGLQQALGGSSRFSVSRSTEVLMVADALGKNFGTPLHWETIDRLCKQYNADAVLSLEFLDTDFIVTNGQKTTQATTAGAAPTVTYWAEGVGNVKAGFRLYDPIRKQIAYQNGYRYSNKWESSASNATEALNRLIAKDIATKQISYSAGQDFGFKVVPSTSWESRTLMKGKSFPMKKALRATRVNDWEAAIFNWKVVCEKGSDMKERGAAAYNLALAYEVKGELEEAKKWVSEAYTRYSFRRARAYAAVIDRRIADEARLREQLQ